MAAAAARVLRDACQGNELAMIDSLDWWTLPNKILHVLSRVLRWLTIDQKRVYACGVPSTCCDSNIRACQTLWRGISILDEWTRAVLFECHTSGAAALARRRACAANMRALIDAKFVGRARTQFGSRWKISRSLKAVYWTDFFKRIARRWQWKGWREEILINSAPTKKLQKKFAKSNSHETILKGKILQRMNEKIVDILDLYS